MLVWGVKWRDQRPVDLSVRSWNAIGRRVHQAMADFWRLVLLPKHFTASAKYRYQHQERTSSYRKAKATSARRGIIPGQNVPIDNVFRGDMRRQLESGASTKVFPSRFVVRMRGPRYMEMRRFQSNQPDKRAELLRDTEAERQELFELGNRTLIEELKLARGTQTVQV